MFKRNSDKEKDEITCLQVSPYNEDIGFSSLEVSGLKDGGPRKLGWALQMENKTNQQQEQYQLNPWTIKAISDFMVSPNIHSASVKSSLCEFLNDKMFFSF